MRIVILLLILFAISSVTIATALFAPNFSPSIPSVRTDGVVVSAYVAVVNPTGDPVDGKGGMPG